MSSSLRSPQKLKTYLLSQGHNSQLVPLCPGPLWFLALDVCHTKIFIYHGQADTDGHTICLFVTEKVVANQTTCWPARAED